MKKGFTLIELLFCITVMGVLASVLLIQLKEIQQLKKANIICENKIHEQI